MSKTLYYKSLDKHMEVYLEQVRLQEAIDAKQLIQGQLARSSIDVGSKQADVIEQLAQSGVKAFNTNDRSKENEARYLVEPLDSMKYQTGAMKRYADLSKESEARDGIERLGRMNYQTGTMRRYADKSKESEARGSIENLGQMRYQTGLINRMMRNDAKTKESESRGGIESLGPMKYQKGVIGGYADKSKESESRGRAPNSELEEMRVIRDRGIDDLIIYFRPYRAPQLSREIRTIMPNLLSDNVKISKRGLLNIIYDNNLDIAEIKKSIDVKADQNKKLSGVAKERKKERNERANMDKAYQESLKFKISLGRQAKKDKKKQTANVAQGGISINDNPQTQVSSEALYLSPNEKPSTANVINSILPKNDFARIRAKLYKAIGNTHIKNINRITKTEVINDIIKYRINPYELRK